MTLFTVDGGPCGVAFSGRQFGLGIQIVSEKFPQNFNFFQEFKIFGISP
jgi:hypothetical protein